MKCMMCHLKAKFMRSTQFAGDHPFCSKHAREEEGFMQNDSYQFWYKIEKPKRDKEVKSKLGYSRVGLGNV